VNCGHSEFPSPSIEQRQRALRSPSTAGNLHLELIQEANSFAGVQVNLLHHGIGGRGDIVQEIIALVRDVANALPAKPTNPLDDDMPGG
jgi:hypothetical protein